MKAMRESVNVFRMIEVAETMLARILMFFLLCLLSYVAGGKWPGRKFRSISVFG